MPIIQFDVLVPHAQAQRVGEVFETATTKLVAAGKLSSASVQCHSTPALYEGIEEQLRENYRNEHHGDDLEDAEVYRYDIAVDGVTGSINQLAMVLSRLLTPHAVLPKDHVLLEDEAAHELPAIFPWTLEIRR